MVIEIIAIIITGYILNILLTRWINKKVYQLSSQEKPLIFIWFFPIVGPLVFAIVWLVYYINNIKTKKVDNRFINWFIGANWE